MAALTRDLGVAPEHRAAGYRCSIVSRESGWFAHRYDQLCHWSFADYYRVGDAAHVVERHGLSGKTPQDCPHLFPPATDDVGLVTTRVVPAGAGGSECGEAPSLETLRP